MIIYAHRGNLAGVSSARENTPKAVLEALDEEFGVEVDLRKKEGQWFFGHDGPTYPVNLAEFDRPDVMFHLKTPDVPSLRYADAFALDRDPYSLTLRGRLWTNYGEAIGSNSIACAPELVLNSEPLEAFARRSHGAFGVCTDFPRQFAALMKEYKE